MTRKFEEMNKNEFEIEEELAESPSVSEAEKRERLEQMTVRELKYIRKHVYKATQEAFAEIFRINLNKIRRIEQGKTSINTLVILICFGEGVSQPDGYEGNYHLDRFYSALKYWDSLSYVAKEELFFNRPEQTTPQKEGQVAIYGQET